MNNCLSLIFFLFIWNGSIYAQRMYENGYFIQNDGSKVECLIENEDGGSCPRSFNYTTKTAIKSTVDIHTVKEFGVLTRYKYVRDSVDIDRYNHIYADLESYKDSKLKREQLFLEKIVEGEASLYEYRKGELVRYFIQMGSLPIEPLIYVRYYLPHSKVVEHTQYKQQLIKAFNSSGLDTRKVDRLRYKRKDLLNIFVAFNTLKNPSYEPVFKKIKKKRIFLIPRAGLTLNILNVNKDLIVQNTVAIGFKVGLEVRIVLPYSYNRLAFELEPSYLQFDFKNEYISYTDKSISFPIGFRYVFWKKNSSNVSIHGAVVTNFVISTDFQSKPGLRFSKLSRTARRNHLYGIEYTYNDKYSIRLARFTNRFVPYVSTRAIGKFDGLIFDFGITL